MAVELAPITDADVPDVAQFMTTHLNSRVTPEAWCRALDVPWPVSAPNHGFLLRDAGRVVGAYLAYYSERTVAGRSEQICNLGAWCVLDEFRFQGVRLLTTLLAQPGYHFTDLSPSGNVVPLNKRLKFTELDTSTALVPNLPWPVSRYRVVSDPASVEGLLSGPDLAVYQHHRLAAAARHLVVASGQGTCYVVFRKDSRRNVRAFASILHVSNPALFRRAARSVARHLLLHHGAAATLVELRVCGGKPAGSFTLKRSRPKMFRSPTMRPEDVDYLYSELTCLDW